MTSQREAELEKKIKELETVNAKLISEAKNREQVFEDIEESKIPEAERLAKFNDSTFDPEQIKFEDTKEVIISYDEDEDSHPLNEKILPNYNKSNLLKIALAINEFIVECDNDIKCNISRYNSELRDNIHFESVTDNRDFFYFYPKKETKTEAKSLEYKKTDSVVGDNDGILNNMSKEELLNVIKTGLIQLYTLKKYDDKIDMDYKTLRGNNITFRKYLYTEEDYNELSQIRGGLYNY